MRLRGGEVEIVKKETKETDEMEDFKACNPLVACCILLCSPVPSTPQSLISIWQRTFLIFLRLIREFGSWNLR